ncbi:hypothetical protein [Pseudomonas parafulva]|uniref:Lipoprotein n=1 Tax=Pseudomonas parafulva TaxID=157782 RepID=A0ABM6J1T2_9PSED|nr:hypothetical protein [Pseudomonas parafulva]AQW68333.1 hypothetical protein B2J77_08970 [Pseudomonas parafulva]
MTRLALCLLLLATGASAAQSVQIEKSTNIKTGVNRVHDDQRGVTCYVYFDGGPGGISCIPDSQLQAGSERQLSPHETQPEPTPAMAPGRWIDERYEL